MSLQSFMVQTPMLPATNGSSPGAFCPCIQEIPGMYPRVLGQLQHSDNSCGMFGLSVCSCAKASPPECDHPAMSRSLPSFSPLSFIVTGLGL